MRYIPGRLPLFEVHPWEAHAKKGVPWEAHAKKGVPWEATALRVVYMPPYCTSGVPGWVYRPPAIPQGVPWWVYRPPYHTQEGTMVVY